MHFLDHTNLHGLTVSLIATLLPARIYTQKYKQENGKTPERRTAVGKEGERDTDDRTKTYHHPDIDT